MVNSDFYRVTVILAGGFCLVFSAYKVLEWCLVALWRLLL